MSDEVMADVDARRREPATASEIVTGHAPAPVRGPGRREQAIQHAGLSFLIPGLGQVAQRRFITAAVQFGTVSAYVVAAHGLGGHRAMFLAAAWNLWSAIDAFRHRHD